jgi:selenocysteine-specific elongation factor
VPVPGDRVVIRQIAPPDTLGGGVVLDPHPRKHGPSRQLLLRLERMSRGEVVEDESAGRTKRQPAGTDARDRPSTAPLTPSALAAQRRLKEAGLEPPADTEFDPADLAALRAAGRAVRVSRTLHYHSDVLDGVRERVIGLAQRNGGAVTLAQLRDELETSRKFAQALLEHFDSEKLTLRRGDDHVLRRLRAAR